MQASALLLRLCGPGKVTHLLRSNPPACTRHAAAAFDAALLQAYEELAGLDPLATTQAMQCRLPLRLGGRGLRSQEELAPAAWAASWAQCLSEVRERSGLTCLGDLDTCDLPLAAACRDALASLPPAAQEEPGTGEPLTWAELAQRPRSKLQKVFTQRLDLKNYQFLHDTLGPEDKARLRSCSGPLAAGWQVATPAAPRQRLDDEDYKFTARALLGQDLAPAGALCSNLARTGANAGQACGQALCRKARHAFRCARGGGTKARSADMEQAWARLHTECGCHAEHQVHVPGWDRWHWRCHRCNTRGTQPTPPAGPCESCGEALEAAREEAVLDLEVQGAGLPRTFFDVTVRYSVPGDAEGLAAAAARDGAVNRKAEADKRSRYPAGQTPWRVVPLAIETCGRHGLSALRHLRKLARSRAQQLRQAGDEEAARAASALVQRWGAELSVALHRATARQVRGALGEGLATASPARELAEEACG